MGPDLPWDFSSHCTTKFNSTHTIITGGAGTKYATQFSKILRKLIETKV